MSRALPKVLITCSAVLLIAPALGCGGGGGGSTTPPPPTTTYTLTVQTSNPDTGVAISVSPSDNSSNGNGSSSLTRTYNSGTSVTLIAPNTSGSNTFDSWQGCTSKNGTTCTVTMSANTKVTAYYVSPVPTAWNLTWSDEFNATVPGTAPDGTKWGYDTGASGFGNNELECYTNSTNNSYQDGTGNLVIEAKSAPGTICSDNKTTQYTSARLLTKGKFSQKYGKVEARIKLPYGQGIWPAFWMLGNDIDTVSWPACGEIDILENVTSVGHTKISSALHSTGFDSPGATKDVGGNIEDDYHVYGVIWTPNKVQFYVDNEAAPFATFTPANMSNTGQWKFDHPFFLILNVAVGGNWPGNPDSTTFANGSQKMYVDWVHVYDDGGVSR